MKTIKSISTTISRLVTWISRVLDIVVGSLLLTIVIIMIVQIIGRYALGSSLIWSEELTRLLHIWMVMLATIKAGHMRIDLLVGKLSDRLQLFARMFSAFVSGALLILMIRGGLNMIELTVYDKYTGLDLSMKYVYVALVFAAVLWLPMIICQIFPSNPNSE